MAALLVVVSLGCPARGTQSPAAVADSSPTRAHHRADAARTGHYPEPAIHGKAERRWFSQDAAPSAITGAPVAAAGKVFFGTADGRLLALSSVDGALLWELEVGEGPITAPAVADDVVVVGGVKGIHAVDIARGEKRWTAATRGPVRGAAAVVESVVFVGTEAALRAVSLTDGEEVWSRSFPGGVHTAIAYFDGMLYAGVADTKVSAYDVQGTERWQVSVGAPVATPAVDDDHVYVGSLGRQRPGHPVEGLRALRRTDGKVVWTLQTEHPVVGPAAVANDAVYVITSAGRLRALGRETGTVHWTAEIKLRSGSAARGGPTVSGPHVLVAVGAQFRGFDTASGKQLWKQTLLDFAIAPPNQGTAAVYVGTAAGTVSAFAGASR